jgi:hypothetical protein
MSTNVIRIASRDLGRNRALTDGFILGTLPEGGYGVRWRMTTPGHVDTAYWSLWEPAGLGTTMYWFSWEPPQDPVRIEFNGGEFIFCRDTASEAEVRQAAHVQYEQRQEGR